MREIIQISNVQILCHQCNMTKANRTEKEFFEYCKKINEKFNIK